MGFLLAFDDLSQPPVSVSPPFDLEQGLLATAGFSARDDQTLILLLLDDEALSSTGARRTGAPASEVRLELEPEDCPAGRLDRSAEPTRLRISVRRAARAYVALVEAQRFEPVELEAVDGLARARLSLPVEPGGCPSISPERVRDYDPDRPELLEADATLRGQPARPRGFIPLDLVHLQLRELDPERVVGVSPRELLLYVRGESFRDLPTRRLAPAEVPALAAELTQEGEVWAWRGATVVPGRTSAGRAFIASALLEVGGDDARQGFRSALVEVRVDELGFAEVRTATVWSGEVREVLVEEDGRVFALWNESGPDRGSDRSAYVSRAPRLDGPWDAQRISRDAAARTMVATLDPARPHVVGLVVAQVLLGDLSQTPPALTPIIASWSGHADTITSLGRDGSLTLWVGTERGDLVRLQPAIDGVSTLPLRIPLEAAACGGSVDDCGWPLARERFLSLEYLPELDALAAVLQACEALLLFRTRDLCPSAVGFPGAPGIGESRAARATSRTERGLLFFEPSSRAAEVLLR